MFGPLVLKSQDPLISFVDSKIISTKIFIVSKTRCPACTQAKQLLNLLSDRTAVTPSVFEIGKYGPQRAKQIVKHLSAQTGINTVPQIWINGMFVGGNDDIQKLHREGRLVSLIVRMDTRRSKIPDLGPDTRMTLRPLQRSLSAPDMQDCLSWNKLNEPQVPVVRPLPVQTSLMFPMQNVTNVDLLNKRSDFRRQRSRSTLSMGESFFPNHQSANRTGSLVSPVPMTYMPVDTKYDMLMPIWKAKSQYTAVPVAERRRASFSNFSGYASVVHATERGQASFLNFSGYDVPRSSSMTRQITVPSSQVLEIPKNNWLSSTGEIILHAPPMILPRGSRVIRERHSEGKQQWVPNEVTLVSSWV